jgi:hypothetical protein
MPAFPGRLHLRVGNRVPAPGAVCVKWKAISLAPEHGTPQWRSWPESANSKEPNAAGKLWPLTSRVR